LTSDGGILKKISLILVVSIGLFVLGSAVYASPLNQKATEFLDYCLSIVKSEEDLCEITKELNDKPITSNKDKATSTPHCMVENTGK
jgi:hypothetical protein